MLISSMIVFPTVTALQVSRSFKSTIVISALIPVAAVIIGVLASYVLNFPSGATIVMVNALVFIVFFALKPILRS
jgi:zinc transport system permease protein